LINIKGLQFIPIVVYYQLLNVMENYMKQLSILGLVLIANIAVAHEDTATIKRVEPQYSTVNTPKEVCRDETVQETIQPQQPQAEKSYGGAILGGLAGGILGNQVGKGNGRSVATAVGAVAGALVGDNIGNQTAAANGNIRYEPQTVTRQVRHCHTEETSSQVVTGYRVDYTYNGRPYSFVSQQKPIGSKLRVNVDVQPILN
jgi:uncharacterized protein YcfJ